jgi:hypothetical protein
LDWPLLIWVGGYLAWNVAAERSVDIEIQQLEASLGKVDELRFAS